MKKDMDICVMEGVSRKQAYEYACNMKEVRSLTKNLDMKERASIELTSKEIYKGYINTVIARENTEDIERAESSVVVNNNYKTDIISKEKANIGLGYKALLDLTNKLNNNKYVLLQTIESDQEQKEVMNDNMNELKTIYKDINCDIAKDYFIESISRKQVINEVTNKLVNVKSNEVLHHLVSNAAKISNEELNIMKEEAIKEAEYSKEIMKDILDRNENNKKEVYLSREEIKEICEVICIANALNQDEVILDHGKEESVIQEEKQNLQEEKIISEYEMKKVLEQEQEQNRDKDQEQEIILSVK